MGIVTSRYVEGGVWLKGNTHIHTPASDGGTPVPEITRLYADAGYDFLFRTDHWAASDVGAEEGDRELLWLDGIELDGTDHAGGYFHVVGLGRVVGIERGMGFMEALSAARQQGAFLVLAHPRWSGNSHWDALRHRFDAVEIYNHVCHWLNGKSDGGSHWDAALAARPATCGIACDDAHLSAAHPGMNGGWVMVNAADRGRAAILDAIHRGDFYSTCGPRFERIRCTETTVEVVCSPVQFARLTGPAAKGLRLGGFSGATFTEFSFNLPGNWDYARIEIEDVSGRRAWTNALV